MRTLVGVVIAVPLWPVAALVFPMYGFYRAWLGDGEDDPDSSGS
jgi:hypothetical protein